MKNGSQLALNRPQKGDIISVSPVRSLRDISHIKKNLWRHPRNYALFVVGINTSFRASELVSIRVGDVKHLRPMDSFKLREKKTGKVREIHFNQACVLAVRKLLSSRKYSDDDFLFRSERTGGALTVSAVHRLVKSWCRDLNLLGNFGSHTLRKTWGYHQHSTYGVSLASLMKCFGHSDSAITLRYLCISDADLQRVYSNEL